MRRLLVVLAVLVVSVVSSGCASTSPEAEFRRLYSPPFFGDRIGDFVRIRDVEKKAVFYYRVDRNGPTNVKAYLEDGSTLRAVDLREALK